MKRSKRQNACWAGNCGSSGKTLATDGPHYIVAKHDHTPPEEPLARRRQDGVEGKYTFLQYIEDSEGISIKPPCAVL